MNPPDRTARERAALQNDGQADDDATVFGPEIDLSLPGLDWDARITVAPRKQRSMDSGDG